jgi:hypothetical protein
MGRAVAGVLALLLLAPAALWVVFASFAAVPCGIEGQGILQSTSSCKVEVHHVLSLVFGFGGVVVLMAGVLVLLAYAISGTTRMRRLSLRLLLTAGVLAFAWTLAALG